MAATNVSSLPYLNCHITHHSKSLLWENTETARRALPVLATLFLLSYTKVLLLVSSVLFFYSTTTHLPSNKATVLWLVDPNVPVFGAKFTILFAICFILFLYHST